MLLLVALLAISCAPVQAQVVAFKKSDINSSTSGSYSFSAGTYTLTGAGSGIGTGTGTADSFTMASFPVTGNVEVIAKVTGESGSGLNAYSQAGLMIRSDLTANSQSYFVGVSPSGGNGINFAARKSSGAISSTTLGPSLAPAVWLRLVVSGQDIAAYESADASNWVLVGRSKSALASVFYVGLAVSSNQAAVLSSASFQNVGIFTNVPQRGPNMQLWLRGDAGAQHNGSAVDAWIDQGLNGNHATSTGTLRPTFVSGAIAGLPAVEFSAASSQTMSMPEGFVDFSQGMTTFVVAKPTAASSGSILTALATASGVNSLYLYEVFGTDFGLAVSDGSAAITNVDDNTLSLGSFQLLEATQFGSTAELYRNGALDTTSSTMNTIATQSRNNNVVGALFTGQIAEIIVLNKLATATERQSVENYFQSKYGVGSAAALAAPTIFPNNQVLTASSYEVTMSADPDAVILYTTDGSDPDPASSSTNVYLGPITGSASNTIYKAISVSPGKADSAVTSSQIRLEPKAAKILKEGLQFWLRSDNGIVLNGTSVTTWFDASGNNNSFVQTTGANQPAFISSESTLNNLPAVSFGGSESMICSANLHAWPGASIFVVLTPTDSSPSGDPRFLDIGNGTTNSDNLGLSQPGGSDFRYFAYNGSSVTTCDFIGGLSVGSGQLIEAVQTPSQVATVYKNNVQGAQVSSFSALQDTPRTSTYLGASSADTLRSQIKVAEVIAFSRALSASERADVEGYLFEKYQLKVSAPVISPSTGMAAAPAVTITADSGAQIYYTVDNSTPTVGNPGTIQYTAPFGISTSTHVEAIAVQSFGTSAVSEAYIGVDAASANVPLTGLQAWLRSDIGVITASGTSISSWIDMANAHTPGATSPNQPTLVSNALNTIPAVNFSQSPTSEVMTFPGTFDFTNGFSAFIVNKIPTPAATADMLTFSNGTNTVNFSVTAAGALQFSTFNTATQSVTSAGGSIASGVPQLFEVVQKSGTATLFRNGEQLASGSVVNSASASLSISQLSNALDGQYFEILLFDHGVTDSERLAIEGYLLNHYQLQAAPIADPVFSVALPATFAAPMQVSVSGPLNSVVRFTTDNTAVTSSSPILLAPINVSYTMTIRAKAFLNNIESNEVSGTATLDAITFPPPGTGTTAPVLNLQLPTTAQ